MAVDQLNFLIYEPNPAAQQVLRRVLMQFAMAQDVDIQMDWIREPARLVHLPKLAPEAHFALLDADDLPYSLKAGQSILEANPQCAIVYYGSRTADLSEYFPSRPVRYLDRPEQEELWQQTLTCLHDRLRQDRAYFSWTSKFCRYYIPCSQIVAIRSGGGNLDVHTASGKVHTFSAKLDEAQIRLPEQDFLRVHKSALVNIHRIEAMDRSDKSLLLSDGSRAYISKVHYKEVTEALEAFRGKA